MASFLASLLLGILLINCYFFVLILLFYWAFIIKQKIDENRFTKEKMFVNTDGEKMPEPPKIPNERVSLLAMDLP